MGRTTKQSIPRLACRILAGAVSLVLPATSFATITEWVGGHSLNWSDPFNWDFGVPTNGGTIWLPLRNSVPSHILQDVSTGVTLSAIESYPRDLTTPFLIEGNRIDLAAGANVVYRAPNPLIANTEALTVRAPVRLLGTATFESQSDHTWLSGAHVFYEVAGAGSVVAVGRGTAVADHTLVNPTYTGTTTVRSGMLRLGGAIPRNFSTYDRYYANTSGQADYTIVSGATLTGMGTIGLATSADMTVAGELVPGSGAYLGLGEDGGSGASMTINGDLVFADGGAFGANFIASVAKLTVHGTLDLRSVGDRLLLHGVPDLGRTHVAIEYQNRLGSFDILPAANNAHIAYTSGENAGPGQVLITFPEPSVMALLVGAPLLIMRRTKRQEARLSRAAPLCVS